MLQYILQLFDIFVNRKRSKQMDWDLGRIIAMNLKQLRTERSLTLGQLAKESGVSKAILSDMEKGESNPTINTIIKVSKGLNVPYSRLMEGVEPESTLVRQQETVMQANENHHYRIFCYFTTSPKRNFELFRVELDPNSSNVSIAHPPKSQEYLYVLEGELTLETETASYTLHPGDSLGFASSVPHTYHNRQTEQAVFLCINYHPNF
jgi:transcriptional regulator with XRE-family HTH domain